MKNAGGAVVIGGDARALDIVRSLGRRGVPVWVLREGPSPLAAVSRYARRRLPWPAGDEEVQIDYLIRLARGEGAAGWVLFATEDETARLLARYHDRLSGYFRVTIPPWDVFRWAYDKRCTYELASRIGVDHPTTMCPRDRRDVAGLATRFPVILKPAVKRDLNALTMAKAWLVEDAASLLDRYDAACRLVPPELILVQDVVPGGGEAQFSYAALCENGEPWATVVAQRRRQYPPDFGRQSSYVETVACPEIEEPARRLLAAMRFTGLVEVEFKYDARDGRHKLLDVNARAWSWHGIGRRAGVDFPYLFWRRLRGETFEPVAGAVGVRWMRVATDVLSATREILDGELSARSYLRSLHGPIALAPGTWDDPLPALVEVPALALTLQRHRRLSHRQWMPSVPA